jgi:uncharacterized protein with ParB-like and HNH nuclease domain
MSSILTIDTRVRSLKTYLEEFLQGAFKVPSFQRDFLWEQDDIRDLFDSIKNNYPIGSILFWKPIENYNAFNDKDSKIGPYTVYKTSKEPVYILDGYQRLSSLFGCLTNYNKVNLKFDEKEWKKKFNLYYDLEEDKFIYLRQNSKNLPYQVPVYIFINSIDFRQYARKEFEQIVDESKIEQYYDRADKIGQIFNNYQIASVDINQATITEAVEIFSRVNEKGLPISKDWIVSALTHNEDFRLGSQIDILLSELKQYSFDKIKRDVIFQCIQNSFGRIYFDYDIEDLVKRRDFIEVTKKALVSIKKAAKFYYENLMVFNSKLLPYNSQLIFLIPFFNHLGDKEPTDKQIIALKTWFWITSYSGYFTIYSLNGQRKAYTQFQAFVEDENENPVYNDRENSKFEVNEFPPRIYMNSVRAKTLALFMINYSKGIKTVGLDKIDVNTIEKFDISNLVSKSQKDNPAENFLPVIEYREQNNDTIVLKSISTIKNPKNYDFLLSDEQAPNMWDNLFVTQEMKDVYKKTKDEDAVLSMRKTFIMKQEKIFVENNLGLLYLE